MQQQHMGVLFRGKKVLAKKTFCDEHTHLFGGENIATPTLDEHAHFFGGKRMGTPLFAFFGARTNVSIFRDSTFSRRKFWKALKVFKRSPRLSTFQNLTEKKNRKKTKKSLKKLFSAKT
jgi:hypothetical protein